MRVLAVDPGYDRLGVAVLEHNGGRERLLYSTCIETNKSDKLPTRLGYLGQQFDTLLAEYLPDRVALETIFFNKNQKTAIAVAEARGVLLYLSHQRGIKILEFGPQEVKVAVTGYGKSDKEAVIDMVRRLVKEAPATALDDEYDAIAVGITALAHHSHSTA